MIEDIELLLGEKLASHAVPFVQHKHTAGVYTDPIQMTQGKSSSCIAVCWTLGAALTKAMADNLDIAGW